MCQKPRFGTKAQAAGANVIQIGEHDKADIFRKEDAVDLNLCSK